MLLAALQKEFFTETKKKPESKKPLLYLSKADSVEALAAMYKAMMGKEFTPKELKHAHEQLDPIFAKQAADKEAEKNSTRR